MKSLSFFFILFLFGTIHSQTIINVPGDYSTIQQALNQAQDYTTIKVAAGIYYENISWPSFLDNTTLEGEGSDVTIIDGSGNGRVFGISGVDNAVIKGFTLQNGYIYNDPVGFPLMIRNGAGLYVFATSPTLEDLIIKDNFAEGNSVLGVGLYCFDYHGTMTNCKVINNQCLSLTGNIVYGAGFYARKSSGTFTNCEFTDNRILGEDLSPQSNGAGFYIELFSDISFDNCLFDNNLTSKGSGAGLWMGNYDDVKHDINVEITNCQISNNISESRANGSGMVIRDTNLVVRIDSCEFINNVTEFDEDDFLRGWGGALYVNTKKLSISNTEFVNNKARFGAAIALSINNEIEGGPQNVEINSCTFNSNDAIEGSALYTRVNFNMQLFFKNCVFTKNKGTTLSSTGLLASQDQINFERIFFEHCTIAYNDDPIFLKLVEFDAVNSIFWNPTIDEFISEGSNFNLRNCVVNGGGIGTNTIAEDPLFFSQDELIFDESSPCISAGAEDISIDTDINGNPRPFPPNTPPDIGAYELEFGMSAIDDLYSLDIKIFPNPVGDILHFDQAIDGYKVYGIDGKEVLRGIMLQNLSVNELEAGVYTIKVWKRDETGLVKFVKL